MPLSCGGDQLISSLDDGHRNRSLPLRLLVLLHNLGAARQLQPVAHSSAGVPGGGYTRGGRQLSWARGHSPNLVGGGFCSPALNDGIRPE